MYLGAKGVSAVISPCGKFRYRLTRQWGEGAALPFVMLNPSTADAEQDDPTIRKCVGFAKRMGYDGIEVVNLYAYRATKPADLKKAGYPRGPENDRHIEAALVESHANSVICAWGVNARGCLGPPKCWRSFAARGCDPRRSSSPTTVSRATR